MVSQMRTLGPKRIDTVLWSLVAVVVVMSFGANYYFTQYSALWRTLGILIGLAVSAFLVYKTTQGKKLWTLWLESLQEVRKMYWPTRQETVQTTVAVLVMVFVMGILLWSADFVLLRAVKWLTGHWGA